MTTRKILYGDQRRWSHDKTGSTACPTLPSTGTVGIRGRPIRRNPLAETRGLPTKNRVQPQLADLAEGVIRPPAWLRRGTIGPDIEESWGKPNTPTHPEQLTKEDSSPEGLLTQGLGRDRPTRVDHPRNCSCTGTRQASQADPGHKNSYVGSPVVPAALAYSLSAR